MSKYEALERAIQIIMQLGVAEDKELIEKLEEIQAEFIPEGR